MRARKTLTFTEVTDSIGIITEATNTVVRVPRMETSGIAGVKIDVTAVGLPVLTGAIAAPRASTLDLLTLSRDRICELRTSGDALGALTIRALPCAHFSLGAGAQS